MNKFNPEGSQQQNQEAAEFRISGLEKVIESIIAISDYETDELKKNRTFDIATTNMRKARLLLDFNTAARDVETSRLPERTLDRLKLMQIALRRSLRQYQFHASAIREVTSIITEANRAQQGDGTYSNRKFI